MAERRGRSKPRKTNRGLAGTDNGGIDWECWAGDRTGESNGEKGRTSVTGQQ